MYKCVEKKKKLKEKKNVTYNQKFINTISRPESIREETSLVDTGEENRVMRESS